VIVRLTTHRSEQCLPTEYESDCQLQSGDGESAQIPNVKLFHNHLPFFYCFPSSNQSSVRKNAFRQVLDQRDVVDLPLT
jgi:hypothetical protein